MRNIFFFMVIVSLASCYRPEAPQFKYVENVRVELESLSAAMLHADAILFNPNKNSVTIKAAEIDILMEDKVVGRLDMEYDLKVEGNSEFSVPLEVRIQMKDLNLNALGSAFGLFGNSRPELHYLGKIKVKAYGVPFAVKVDYRQKVNIRL